MSTLTTNYKFIKPQLSDPANIEATNPNWDSIDEILKNQGDSTSNAVKVISELRLELTQAQSNLNKKIADEVAKLQPKITYGSETPSGGNSGDVYIQLIEE